jgi:hypothetical protein
VSGGKRKAKQTPCASNIRESFTLPQPQDLGRARSATPRLPASYRGMISAAGGKNSPAYRPTTPPYSFDKYIRMVFARLEMRRSQVIPSREEPLAIVCRTRKWRWRKGDGTTDSSSCLRCGKVLEVLLFPVPFLPCWKGNPPFGNCRDAELTTTADKQAHPARAPPGDGPSAYRHSGWSGGTRAERKGAGERTGGVPGHVQIREG